MDRKVFSIRLSDFYYVTLIIQTLKYYNSFPSIGSCCVPGAESGEMGSTINIVEMHRRMRDELESMMLNHHHFEEIKQK